MKRRELIVAGLCCALAAGAAMAQERRLERAGLADRLAQELNLTADQKVTAAQLEGDLRVQAAPLREQLAQHWSEIRTLLDSTNPDATALGQKLIAAHAVEGQMKALRAEFRTRLGAVLGPEQEAKLESMDARKERGELGRRE